MKKVSFWNIILIAVMTLPMMVACSSDDDDEDVYNSKNIIGTWKLVSQGIDNNWENTNDIFFLQIKKDSTGIMLNETYWYVTTWEQIDNILLITINSYNRTYKFSIESISSKSLTLKLLEGKNYTISKETKTMLKFEKVADSEIVKYMY